MQLVLILVHQNFLDYFNLGHFRVLNYRLGFFVERWDLWLLNGGSEGSAYKSSVACFREVLELVDLA